MPILAHTKVTLLTGCVVLSFYYSSLGWRHFDSSHLSRVLVAAAILVSMYAMMVFEMVNRNLAALIGAAVSVAAYDCLVQRAAMEDILKWQDLETLALLFGMMIIVNVLALSHVFDFLALWAYTRTAGRFWLLTTIMAFVTACLSAFVDNVSTMLLMAPMLIRLAHLEKLDPRYILMIMVLFCNIGGCATPVGDPPNLIIISCDLVRSLDITFSAFVAYCVPCVLLTMGVLLGYLKLTYKSKAAFRLLSTYESKEGCRISSVHVMELDGERPVNRSGSFRSSQSAQEMVESTQTIKNKPILMQALAVLSVAIILFFVQSLPGVNMSLGWISIFAGLTVLVLTSSAQTGADTDEGDAGQDDVFEMVVNNIEWSTLMFFFSLFIVMEVMTELGLIDFMGNQISCLILSLPAGLWRDVGSLSLILWSSALASACIDNVPFTSMMVKVLETMATESSGLDDDRLDSIRPPLRLNMKAMVFALTFGACYGGNGTIIGASANLVTAGVAQRHGHPINFNGFFKFCAVPTLISLLVANIYLVVVFVILDL